MPRFSANLSFLFNEVPFLDRFGEAARAGFTAVEFASGYDHPIDEIALRLATHGLELVLMNVPQGDLSAGQRGLAAIPGSEYLFAASMSDALRYARGLACRRIHVMAGVLPQVVDDGVRARHRDTFVRNLRYAAKEAAGQGVALTIEPINTRDIPGYFLNTQAEAHAIREEVGADNLSVQMDFYHAQIVEGGLEEKFRRWQPHIGHVQIAGVPGRHEPDTGEVNYAYLFRLLDELGYEGWVGCEYRPLRDTRSGLAWRQALTTDAG
ncbi:MAG TPA: 2-oxo-tetronate isomerase [Casimicrobiaceae bacterium]|jgi:hydroxypyruvate isomerase